jgi:hypothetical protein
MIRSRSVALSLFVAASGALVYVGCSSDSTDPPATNTAGGDASVAPAPTSTSTSTPSPVDAGPRACTAGKTLCTDNCVDTQLDRENCGGCGKACAASEVCSQGSCGLACGGGTTKCGSNCADTTTDEKNCGACGTVCAAGQRCQGGADAGASKCTCPAGLTATATGCVDLAVDDANCGVVGTACTAGKECVAGTCKGPTAWWKFEDNLTGEGGVNDAVVEAGGTAVYQTPSYSTTAGKAYFVNGNNTLVVPTVAADTLPIGKAPRTLEAWVHATGFTDGTYNGILSYGTRACNGQGQLLSMTNGYRASSANYCNDLLQPGYSTFLAQAWSHVAYVFDGKTRLLYIDGQEVARDVATPFDTTAGGSLRIGSTDEPGRRFRGWLDDVKIYPYARTPAQLKKTFGSQDVAYAFTAATDTQDSAPSKTSAGTKAGGVTNVADRKNAANQALAFDGADGSQLKVFPVSALGKNRPYTIGVWVKATAAAQGTLVHTSSTANGLGWCVSMLGADATGKPTAFSWNGGAVAVTADDALVAGTWTHLATSFSGDTLKLYVNGVLKKSTPQSVFAASGFANYVTLGTSKVDGTAAGCAGGSTIGGNWNGAVDDFKVWDRELSATEIANEAK